VFTYLEGPTRARVLWGESPQQASAMTGWDGDLALAFRRHQLV